MNTLHSIAGATILAIASVTAAPQKPNFSGTWVAISPADAVGQEETIKQDTATITTDHGSEGDGHSFTYNLDGSESRQVLTSHGEEIVTLARASWRGDQLIITGKTTYPDGRKLTSNAVWSLDADRQLVIESTSEFEGKASIKTKVVLRKKG